MVRGNPFAIKGARRGQHSLMQLTAQQDAELRRILEQAARDSERMLMQLASDQIGAQIRALQYQQMRAQLYDMATQMWVQNIPNVITNNLSTSAQLAANQSKALLATMTAGMAPGQAAILASSMQSSARATFDDVASRVTNDVNLSPSVYNARAYQMGKIDDIVNSGIALGRSAAEIAKEAVQFINPNTPGGASYAAQRLGRTELNNAFHETSRRTYQESPYVHGVEWHLSGSHGSGDECDGLDGEVFAPEEVPDKPHPNCFCYIVPITPSIDQFKQNMAGGNYDCSVVNA